MKNGQQDSAHAEMEISRDLANKTLAQDKSKLAALMDTSGPPDVHASATDAGPVPLLLDVANKTVSKSPCGRHINRFDLPERRITDGLSPLDSILHGVSSP